MSLGGKLLKVTGKRGLRSYQRTIELRGEIEFENLPARQKPQLQLQLLLQLSQHGQLPGCICKHSCIWAEL